MVLQLLVLQSAFVEQPAPFALPQVLPVLVLHSPLWHTAVALLQVPSCRPSLGMAPVAGSLVTQNMAVLLQKLSAVQLASAEQGDAHLLSKQSWETQVGAPVAHVPSWMPSLGIGVVLARRFKHVLLTPSQ